MESYDLTTIMGGIVWSDFITAFRPHTIYFVYQANVDQMERSSDQERNIHIHQPNEVPAEIIIYLLHLEAHMSPSSFKDVNFDDQKQEGLTVNTAPTSPIDSAHTEG